MYERMTIGFGRMVMKLTKQVAALTEEVKTLRDFQARDSSPALGQSDSRDPAPASSANCVAAVTKILQDHLPANVAQVMVPEPPGPKSASREPQSRVITTLMFHQPDRCQLYNGIARWICVPALVLTYCSFSLLVFNPGRPQTLQGSATPKL